LLWVSTRLAFGAGADLSLMVYRRTLYQPYQVHVARNSSEVIVGITNKVSGATGVLLAVLTLISSATLVVAVTLGLLYIDVLTALIAAVTFSVGYVLISRLSRRRLVQNSQDIAKHSTQVHKALQEGLGGIRDVLLDGTQALYSDIYRSSQIPLLSSQSSNQFIGASPRPAMEALGMILISIMAYVLSRKVDGIAGALPLLGALAMGAQRLLPSLQQCYTAWTGIIGNRGSIVDVLELLNQPLPAEAYQSAPAPLPFSEVISFNDVSFRYGIDGPMVLNRLNLTIVKGNRIGIVGGTGSGKSTVLDLLMGLLEPTNGEILVDGGAIVGERRRAWQRTIAHVPQSIYLADTTIAENIAFGVPHGSIDLGRVREAARQAQIAEFIEGRPEGYGAFVGERGIRLSGGQRQRIGIARALYKRASVLVFDEATSALDNITERTLMATIESLSSDLTIVLIAHRLTTVQRCNSIVELEHGRIVAEGSYEQLLERSPSFRTMAQATG
jgi:ABC-type multidrug transport system fused ATPase/permease subunit